MKINRDSAYIKNRLWERPVIANPESEALANKIASYLPDNEKLGEAIKNKEIVYPANMVRWELHAINDRAWSIYLSKVV